MMDDRIDQKYIDFLNALRESGITNMFGAGDYLMDTFDLQKAEARKILSNWMKNFQAYQKAS
tara:strand:+ start:141 stop:326 length:186 start_codon:yes stop_codon:yes gene_type:complete